MKKIYLLLLLVAGFADAQIVNIPDAAFKARLTTSAGVDTNQDGNIQLAEAQACTFLGFSDNAVTDLTGLEAFTNVNWLMITASQVTSIDLSNNTAITTLMLTMPIASIDMSSLSLLRRLELNCAPLTALDYSSNPLLAEFSLRAHSITSMDFTGMMNLTSITFNGTANPNLISVAADGLPQLSSVNLSGVAYSASVAITNCPNLSSVGFQIRVQSLNLTNCTNIELVEFWGDPSLTSQTLIVGGCTALKDLECTNAAINTVDLSTNVNLENLGCYGAKITSIDLSANTKLKSINFNQCQLLTSLDLTSNTALETLNASGTSSLTMAFLKNGRNEFVSMGFNPSLLYVCADASQFAAVQATVGPSILVGDYCSFTPGGNYNTITGSLRFDNNNDGCNSADIIPIYTMIGINDGTNSGATAVSGDGLYDFFTGAGNFTVAPQLEQAAYFNVAPPAVTVNFPLENSSIETRDFCVTASGVHPDTEIILVPRGSARPGFNATYFLIIRNKGNQPASGTALLTFDDAHMDFLFAGGNPSQSGNTISWNYNNLMPFEVRLFHVTMRVNSPIDTPPVNYDDVLAFNANINILSGDDTPADNNFGLSQVVINSFDPNDKTCLEGTNVLPENIGKYLHYNINFENTGTADAINIVVKDTIDTTRFDVNSLQLLYASRPVYTKITGNIVEFIFENINLPPSIMNPIGGHGNVLFKIKTLPTLTVGDEVSNTANIYFDYNAPIDTNEARTAFNNLSKKDFVKDDSVTVYPNPAKNKVTVKATGIVKSVQLYDVQGRILQSVADSKSQIVLDISNQQRGVYFLSITTDKGSAVEKIIKD